MNIKSITLISVILCLHCFFLNAQEADKLNAALDKVMKLSISGNIEDLVAVTSPRLIRAMGGEQKAMEKFKKMYASLNHMGIKIDTAYNYHECEILSVAGIHYTFIPQLIVMSIKDPQKKMINYTSTIAIKEKGTSEWTFIDYNQLNDKTINILLPEFENLEFPRNPTIKPLVIPKEKLQQSVEYLLDEMDKLMQDRKKSIRNLSY